MLVLAALLASALPARAGLIEYKFSGAATGTAGTKFFTNAPFTFVIIGDTANVKQVAPFGPPPIWQIAPLTGARLTIDGVGTGTVTSQLGVYNNDTNEVVGFGRYIPFFGGVVLDFLDVTLAGAGLTTYDLKSAFGPIVDVTPSTPNQTSLSSTLGTVRFTSASVAVFQAQLIPEPASLTLLGVGVAGLLGWARWRRQAAS